MLNSLMPIYETLYDSIVQVMGTDLPKFEKGFAPDDLTYPYMYLDQPAVSEPVDISNPNQYGYAVMVPLVVMTYSEGDVSKLFFNSDLDKPGAFTLLQTVTNRMEASYSFGLPFSPTTDGWNVRRWRIGNVDRPRTPAVQDYLQNTYIAAVAVSFVFEVVENGPLPYNA